MVKQKIICVRMPDFEVKSIDKLVKKYGGSRSDLLRYLIMLGMEQFEYEQEHQSAAGDVPEKISK